MQIIIETSARHIHLSQSDMEKLFGAGYQLNVLKDLSQKGQFAANETLVLKTDKGTFNNVRIVGPVRDKTQVEISLTDARKLGIDSVIRLSGDLAGSKGCVLVGPAGEINLSEGVITAQRHLHLDPETAEKEKLEHGKEARVKVETGKRSLIFDQVVIRVDQSYTPAFHIDTDEANAAGILGEIKGEILK